MTLWLICLLLTPNLNWCKTWNSSSLLLADKWINLFSVSKQTNSDTFAQTDVSWRRLAFSKRTKVLKYCEGVGLRKLPPLLGKDFLFFFFFFFFLKNGWGWSYLTCSMDNLSGLGFIPHLKLEWPRGSNDLDLVLEVNFWHTSPYNARVLTCSATLKKLDLLGKSGKCFAPSDK